MTCEACGRDVDETAVCDDCERQVCRGCRTSVDVERPGEFGGVVHERVRLCFPCQIDELGAPVRAALA